MHFTALLSALVLAATVPLALADIHPSCTCHNSQAYNWRITIDACTIYNDLYNQSGGAVEYITHSGRCDKSGPEDSIDGDNWESCCRKVAVKGFSCTDREGTCFTDPTVVFGSCYKFQKGEPGDEDEDPAQHDIQGHP